MNAVLLKFYKYTEKTTVEKQQQYMLKMYCIVNDTRKLK